jgi:hypothetical protein
LQFPVDLAVADVGNALAFAWALHRDDALPLPLGNVGDDVGRGDPGHPPPTEERRQVLRDAARDALQTLGVMDRRLDDEGLCRFVERELLGVLDDREVVNAAAVARVEQLHGDAL